MGYSAKIAITENSPRDTYAPTRHRDNLHFKMLTYHLHTNILFSCGVEHG